jgi:hypothetical protein
VVGFQDRGILPNSSLQPVRRDGSLRVPHEKPYRAAEKATVFTGCIQIYALRSTPRHLQESRFAIPRRLAFSPDLEHEAPDPDLNRNLGLDLGP